MLWLFAGPTGVYLLDFFCSGIQFYLLLSPYLCFISLVYLDLYVLGDDDVRGLSCKPNIFVSWSTSELRVRLAPWNRFKPASKIFYWPFQGSASFMDLFLYLLCLCARLFICALWSSAGKGLTSWLSFVVSNCEFVTFPLVYWIRCGTRLYRFLIFAALLTPLNW